MIRKITGLSLLATALLGLLPLGCQPGGVGDPCTPEDEYTAVFPGYNSGEVNAEAKSFQCETRLCLVDHFQGRVSCKYGQDAPTSDDLANYHSNSAAGSTKINCTIPGEPDSPIKVQVNPQLKDRQADKAVYCSCRCDGENKSARYCKCPSGYSCQHDIDNIGVGNSELAGSYCIRNGAYYQDTANMEAVRSGAACSPTGYPNATPSSAQTCGTDNGN